MAFIPTAWPSMCSNIKIVNKTIVHSDTVLNLKDLGEDIKVTEVSGISKNDLEGFLNIVFKNNKDVLFNTVQYSEEKKKVWIYANKSLNVKCWEERNLKKYKYADPNNLIDYLKNIIEDPDAYTNKDSSSVMKPIPVSDDEKYVSIDMINKIQMKKTKEIHDKKEKLVDEFEKRFERIDGHSVGVSCFSPEFNYDKNTMNIEFKPRCSDNWYKIDFGKKCDDLYIANSTYYNNDQILLNYADIFSKLYDLYFSNKSYETEKVLDSIDNIYNAKFRVNIGSNYLKVYLTSSNDFAIGLFSGKYLEKSGYEKEYKLYGFSSQKEIAFVNENVDKIVKNLYVEVDKLPSYMKEMIKKERKKEEERKLELIRKKQEKEREAEKQRLLEEKRRLEEQKALEEKLRIKEEKKAKRKALVRKLNIFKKGN